MHRTGSDVVIEHRFAIRWDEDNDERVLGAVLAFYFCAPREFRFCHAFGEHKGLMTAWQLGFEKDVQRALHLAIRSHPVLDGDEWPVETIDNFLPSASVPHSEVDPDAEVDRSLAALHEIYRLGSFGGDVRPWGEAP